jgi:hypothetical protein
MPQARPREPAPPAPRFSWWWLAGQSAGLIVLLLLGIDVSCQFLIRAPLAFDRLGGGEERPFAEYVYDLMPGFVHARYRQPTYAALRIKKLQAARSGNFLRNKNIPYNDDLLYRSDMMLGDDYVVYAYVRRMHPPGTRIRLEYTPALGGEIGGRIQRFWLALLPEYPLVDDSPLVLGPRDQTNLKWRQPGDEELITGQYTVLVRRRWADGGAR